MWGRPLCAGARPTRMPCPTRFLLIRAGVRRGQVDMSARVIWVLEKLGWARDVRWPTPARLARIDARGSSIG